MDKKVTSMYELTLPSTSKGIFFFFFAVITINETLQYALLIFAYDMIYSKIIQMITPSNIKEYSDNKLCFLLSSMI